jgi:hypothetical protein
MNTTAAGELVLKTDTRGRVRTPLARREQLLDEFEQSGLSGKKFAELLGLKYQTFATWAQKRRRARGAPAKVPAKVSAKSADAVRWLEAVVEQAGPPGALTKAGLVLELPGGAKACIADAKQAALAVALLRALESSATSC